MIIKFLSISILFFIVISCSVNKTTEIKKATKIKVLNFGTFHMGYTNDASTTEFDEHNKKNQQKVHEIAKKLAKFKPTVIIVESPPEYNETLKQEYDKYLKDPNMFFEHPTEIELLAYELGRLSGTKKIYGIDHKMSYNYMIGNQIENTVDTSMYNQFYTNPFSFFPSINVNMDSLNLFKKLKLMLLLSSAINN